MKRNRQLFWRILVVITLTVSLSSTAQVADYEEQGGVVVMEAESFDIAGTGWVRESTVTGATAGSYIRSPLGSTGGIVESTTLEVKIKINNPGKYIFKWRARVGRGTDASEHNDSWLKFPDADDFYGEKPTGKVWPKDSGKTPNPSKGPGVDGFFKVYSALAASDWGWFGRTCDGCSYAIFAEFNTAKIYTMSISSRSQDNLIDRIVLSKKAEDVGFTSGVRFDPPLDATTPETGFTLVSPSLDLKNIGVSIYPIPAQEVLNIKGIASQAKIELVDMFGRVLPTRIISATDTRTQLDLLGLAKGVYFVSVNGAIGSFIKQ